jgi:hypothetical protein
MRRSCSRDCRGSNLSHPRKLSVSPVSSPRRGAFPSAHLACFNRGLPVALLRECVGDVTFSTHVSVGALCHTSASEWRSDLIDV